MTKEKFKTMHHVFDEFTNRVLFKLITQGHFKGLESPISVGKESNIFSALTDEGKKVIVKIYRLETCDFNRMHEYIGSDPRYDNLKKNKRKVIFAWVQREYRNLLKAREGNVKVPVPIVFLSNVLVEEFIGNENPSPKLKDQIPKDLAGFFNLVVENMTNLYKAGIVHADLSAFNILNFNEIPVFIDMSQATLLNNPSAETYLARDVTNICKFFRKKGLEAKEDKVIKRIRNIKLK